MKIKAPPLSKRMRLFIVCVLMIVSFNSIPYISAVGNDNQPKYILMRLEDVGPGGQYEGPEQLGKLRAVMELLKEYKVRYQMAVIPRWIDIAKDGKRYDVSLDKSDDPYVESFVNLLKQAESSGAVIGMHGYTHQVGDVRRADGQHESGIGNEFNVLDVEETNSPKYAQKRVEEAKQIFDGINIHPKFWEAPHYQTTPEQDEVFRCYFGLLYQADMHKDRNTVTTQYAPARNTRVGETSLGAVNVPTPLSYIPYNRDADIILNQLDKADRLPSFFFHPFLEFKHLIPVLDSDGDPVIQDGIPLYKYPAKAKSILQKLLIQLEQKEYKFIPITDFIPFSPAKSVPLEEVSDRNVQLADVTGDGQADVVRWDAKRGEIRVKAGEFKGYRNEPVGDAKTWASIPYHTGDVWTLFDHNSDGRNDLWILRADGQWMSYHSNGSAFVAA
ncbi:MAG: repeat protein, partial [Paenibacillus sp.]|nr:repeat protein [Paenibacillus sp.]